MITWLQINATFSANKTKVMQPAPKKQRFSNLSSTEIQLLIEKKDATKNAVAALLAFCNEISPNESSPRDDKYIGELSSEELNKLLTAFYPNAREKTAKITKNRSYGSEDWSSISTSEDLRKI